MKYEISNKYQASTSTQTDGVGCRCDTDDRQKDRIPKLLIDRHFLLLSDSCL